MTSSSSPPQSQTMEKEEDRISYLSDDILAHILSFLPSKLAGSTTTLSSRWKHVFWSYVTRLSIDMYKESTKDNVEPAIQLFDAVYNCKQLTSVDIVTNYLLLPETIDLPKLKYFHVEVRENIDSLMQGWDSFQKMQIRGCPAKSVFTPFLSANNHLVLNNSKIPRDEYNLEVDTVLSLREPGSATKKKKEPAYVYVDYDRKVEY